MSDSQKESPLMTQYYDAKAKYPDALLLFRVGDFYETFEQDAIKTAGILGITLTARGMNKGKPIELAGFPYHAIDTYLPKLVKAGHRVAICEQLENPKLTKKLVKRGITELVTPGVSYNDTVLNNKENNFLAAVYLNGKNSGVSFLDISTGEFFLAEGDTEYIDKVLHSFKPSEIIIERHKRKDFEEIFGNRFYVNVFDDWVFRQEFAGEKLLKHFGTNSLKGFGIEDYKNGIIAAGAVLHYLTETAHDRTAHITKIYHLMEDEHLWLDKFTVRNLELVWSPNEKATTLFDVLNHCVSNMGIRMLRRWLVIPLRNIAKINRRLDITEFFINNKEITEILCRHIKQIGDLERLISKVSTCRIQPREMVQIKRALLEINAIKNLFIENSIISPIVGRLDLCEELREEIDKCLNEEAPVAVNKGNVIKKGYNAELDDIRSIACGGKEYLIGLQQREIENTGISSLKVGFNNIFGYYIEVTNAHRDKVPADWTRKQTLTGAERYITEELKVYEQKILGAEEKILELETALFDQLVNRAMLFVQQIQSNAGIVALLDCLCCFAQVSFENNYHRPTITDSKVLNIKNGRHPVIEQQLPPSEQYVANNIYLDEETQQIMIITGPNMSGKSSLLRQTALIVLMAQMGCFVPADSAEIGVIDKVFTRVGASDNISSGESTFMVEMNEAASILNNISDRSLILLDEIGRGTSTYDGISIAWAMTEFLHEQPFFKPKVMFATHYHELNEMADAFPRIKNFHVSVKEVGKKVIFLRKLEEGGSEHSFGIHVARMAGMPLRVVERAGEVLQWMERENNKENEGVKNGVEKTQFSSKNQKEHNPYQLSFIQLDDPILEQIREDILDTDINSLTPLDAMMKLATIKRRLEGK
ncbi:DNA mismatch repair protein MutS [Bacteroidia bacterium]|nr:DNA mismatch repair protein MutS [Bacteroidia bacterium]